MVFNLSQHLYVDFASIVIKIWQILQLFLFKFNSLEIANANAMASIITQAAKAQEIVIIM